MRKHLIHLKVEDYESAKKEKANVVEAAKKILVDNAKKAFALALEPYSKTKEIVLLDEEYDGPIFGTAVFIELKDDKFDELRDVLRQMDIVEIIEVCYDDLPVKKSKVLDEKPPEKKKDISRFLK